MKELIKFDLESFFLIHNAFKPRKSMRSNSNLIAPVESITSGLASRKLSASLCVINLNSYSKSKKGLKQEGGKKREKLYKALQPSESLLTAFLFVPISW